MVLAASHPLHTDRKVLKNKNKISDFQDVKIAYKFESLTSVTGK